jgi:spore cortex formation protein SpoVR/YcgB (stage V sporulation)
MNEGWASYWHIRILRELELTSEETLEFAKLNSAVVHIEDKAVVFSHDGKKPNRRFL